ncbi:MAG: hypothetical protein EG825_15415, partial [Rhodocyclaceae bacterium]|nr:hypothetical protein [Rhodocyclaceae bacterium]
MKRFIPIILTCVLISCAGEKEAIEPTPILKISSDNPCAGMDSIIGKSGGKIYYSNVRIESINTRRGDLPKNDPLYTDEFAEGDVLIAKLALDKHSDNDYYVSFTEGPSFDLAYEFFSKDKQYIDNVPGEILMIPGDGYIYAAGHNNNTFLQRSKYRLTDGEFHAIKQPYHYVGLKTRTLMQIRLFSDVDQTEELAVLPVNSDIEVLLAKDGDGISTELLYLVKTPFGIIGWTKIKAGQYKAEEVDGIFF